MSGIVEPMIVHCIENYLLPVINDFRRLVWSLLGLIIGYNVLIWLQRWRTVARRQHLRSKYGNHLVFIEDETENNGFSVNKYLLRIEVVGFLVAAMLRLVEAIVTFFFQTFYATVDMCIDLIRRVRHHESMKSPTKSNAVTGSSRVAPKSVLKKKGRKDSEQSTSISAHRPPRNVNFTTHSNGDIKTQQYLYNPRNEPSDMSYDVKPSQTPPSSGSASNAAPTPPVASAIRKRVQTPPSKQEKPTQENTPSPVEKTENETQSEPRRQQPRLIQHSPGRQELRILQRKWAPLSEQLRQKRKAVLISNASTLPKHPGNKRPALLAPSSYPSPAIKSKRTYDEAYERVWNQLNQPRVQKKKTTPLEVNTGHENAMTPTSGSFAGQCSANDSSFASPLVMSQTKFNTPKENVEVEDSVTPLVGKSVVDGAANTPQADPFGTTISNSTNTGLTAKQATFQFGFTSENSSTAVPAAIPSFGAPIPSANVSNKESDHLQLKAPVGASEKSTQAIGFAFDANQSNAEGLAKGPSFGSLPNVAPTCPPSNEAPDVASGWKFGESLQASSTTTSNNVNNTAAPISFSTPAQPSSSAAFSFKAADAGPSFAFGSSANGAVGTHCQAPTVANASFGAGTSVTPAFGSTSIGSVSTGASNNSASARRRAAGRGRRR